MGKLVEGAHWTHASSKRAKRWLEEKPDLSTFPSDSHYVDPDDLANQFINQDPDTETGIDLDSDKFASLRAD